MKGEAAVAILTSEGLAHRGQLPARSKILFSIHITFA